MGRRGVRSARILLTPLLTLERFFCLVLSYRFKSKCTGSDLYGSKTQHVRTSKSNCITQTDTETEKHRRCLVNKHYNGTALLSHSEPLSCTSFGGSQPKTFLVFLLFVVLAMFKKTGKKKRRLRLLCHTIFTRTFVRIV